MKSIRGFAHKLFASTLLRYFLSYFLLFSVLILGFFFIIRSHITTLYYEQLASRSQEHLSNLSAELTDEIISLNSVTLSMNSNINVIMARYKNNNYYQYLAYQELCNYNAGRPIIESIIYLNKNRDVCTSSGPYINVSYEDGSVHFLTNSSFRFDLESYSSDSRNQLLFLSDENAEYLIYLPVCTSYDNHIFFYLINTKEISQLCKSIFSNEMPAVALVDSQKRIIAGTNTDMLLPYMDRYEMEDGIYSLDDSTSLCVSPQIIDGCHMISLISSNVLLDQVDSAFRQVYLIVLLLGGIGFFLILCSMRNTYLPLRTLTKKLIPTPNSNQGYLEQLDQAFSETAEQNQQLIEKLEGYRLSLQKSILDSVLTSTQLEDIDPQPDIDQFFTMDPDNYIFTIKMQSPGSSSEFPCGEMLSFFREMLPDKLSCVVLEIMGNTAVFLLNYPGTEQHKAEVLKLLMTDLYKENGYLSAISDSSISHMDIPSLYEQAQQASSLWPQTPVSFYEEAAASFSPKSALSYPYDTMNRLSDSLKEGNFADAGGCIRELFQVIDRPDDTEEALPTFFVRCVLIDMLSAFFNALNHSEIKFKSYSDLYFETLFYCRSCPYSENRETIQANMEKLLSFYQSCLEQKNGIALQLKQVVEERYIQPDFSIAQLADQFQISIAYVSYLINKATGQNFSDYVWELRLAKAKELLKTSKCSIDEISIAVGYLNTSSFRRKFKQATGITPSQYRNQVETPPHI